MSDEHADKIVEIPSGGFLRTATRRFHQLYAETDIVYDASSVADLEKHLHALEDGCTIHLPEARISRPIHPQHLCLIGGRAPVEVQFTAQTYEYMQRYGDVDHIVNVVLRNAPLYPYLTGFTIQSTRRNEGYRNRKLVEFPTGPGLFGLRFT